MRFFFWYPGHDHGKSIHFQDLWRWKQSQWRGAKLWNCWMFGAPEKPCRSTLEKNSGKREKTSLFEWPWKSKMHARTQDVWVISNHIPCKDLGTITIQLIANHFGCFLAAQFFRTSLFLSSISGMVHQEKKLWMFMNLCMSGKASSKNLCVLVKPRWNTFRKPNRNMLVYHTTTILEYQMNQC